MVKQLFPPPSYTSFLYKKIWFESSSYMHLDSVSMVTEIECFVDGNVQVLLDW